LRLGESGAIFEWELSDRKRPAVVKTSGSSFGNRFNAGAQPGFGRVGIAYVAEPLGRRYLCEGSLTWLLPQSATEYEGLFLYYPKRASPGAKASRLY
jgi:hypothetical protein